MCTKKGNSIPQGRKEERMLPSLALVSKSSNIKCFKFLGKGHIVYQYPNKRGMITQTRIVGDDDSQRGNIFYSCCHIVGQLCSIIINGGRSVNIPSSRLVEKLKLPTLAHLRPYKLQQLNSKGKLVTLAFTLGKYKDEVLCDIEPMEETHILLGRP
ncbi:hypothetical protein CR513_29145, partial [Mucuna pruriens]